MEAHRGFLFDSFLSKLLFYYSINPTYLTSELPRGRLEGCGERRYRNKASLFNWGVGLRLFALPRNCGGDTLGSSMFLGFAAILW